MLFRFAERMLQAPDLLEATFATPADLAAAGVRRRDLSALVDTGRMVRLRNGRYAPPHLHPDLLRSGALGGRLDCVSLLATLSVFVRDDQRLHVQFEPATTRLPVRPADAIAHWRSTSKARTALAADLIDALVQAVRCQSPRDAIATLDSAWHLGLVDEAGVAEVFRRLPLRFQRLRSLLDPRCESGPETLMRLLLRGLGCRVDVQVQIRGVGRVDFVVDGWLIIECDSREHHSDWEAQKRDRRRDLAAAALGYTTVRPLAEDIMYRREWILAMMKQVIAHRPVQDSTDSRRSPAARAR